MNQSMHVLIVEDEPRLRELFARMLHELGHTSHAVASAEAGLRELARSPGADRGGGTGANPGAGAETYDVLLLDLNLPGMDGMAMFEQLRQRWPGLEVIILTGFGDLDTARRAIRLDVADFLTKPCHLGELETALTRAAQRQARAANAMNKPMPDLSQRDDAPDSAHADVPEGGDGDSGERIPIDADPDANEPLPLEEIEKRHILAALQRNDGNRKAAAEELGISLRTLYYRLARYQDE